MSAAGLRRAGMVDMESNTTLVQQFPAHAAVPEAPSPSPAVLLLHDVYGLTPGIRALANRLAREGFFVLAPNLYGHPFSTATGAPPALSWPLAAAAEEGWSGFPVRSSFGYAEKEEAKALASGLSADRVGTILERALGFVALASEADPRRVGLAGFGVGGRFAFRAACEKGEEIRAVVAWSPVGLGAPYPLRPAETMPILEYEGLRAPALLLYGDGDPEAPREEREAVTHVLATGSVRHEVVVFPGTPHAFFDEESPDFRIGASRTAWEKAVAFLWEALGAS